MASIDNAAAAAYEDVRNDKTATNWFYLLFKCRLLLEYPDDKSDSLVLSQTGTGGLVEFKKCLKNDQAGFGYVRCVVGNDELVLYSNLSLKEQSFS
jgi:hypothetical protein